MTEKLVVVGASLAGLRAIEAVRGDDWDGSIVLVGAEEHLPYDRPPLSKEYLHAEECPGIHFREEDKIATDLDVELVLGTPAGPLDTENHTVTVGDRDISYDALVIATGSHARPLPGSEDLDGVYTIRTLDDAIALRAELRSDVGHLVVVGAGFIGSEVAGVGWKLGLDVTIVEALDTPLSGAIGERMGKALTGLHESYGTTVLTGVSVDEVTGDDGGAGDEGSSGRGHVRQVKLSDGTVLDVDVLVVGIGATPATDWLEGSGLTVDNGVVADEKLQAAPGVWVAGDVARWPNALFDDIGEGPMRLEHWTSAAEQGARAARNAVDPDSAKAYETVPYFWSDWYDSRVQFVGVPEGDHIEVVAGEEGSTKFTALYRANDRIVGCLAVNMRAEVMKYRRLIGQRADWQQALDLAEQRRQKAAEKEAEKESDEDS